MRVSLVFGFMLLGCGSAIPPYQPETSLPQPALAPTQLLAADGPDWADTLANDAPVEIIVDAERRLCPAAGPTLVLNDLAVRLRSGDIWLLEQTAGSRLTFASRLLPQSSVRLTATGSEVLSATRVEPTLPLEQAIETGWALTWQVQGSDKVAEVLVAPDLSCYESPLIFRGSSGPEGTSGERGGNGRSGFDGDRGDSGFINAGAGGTGQPGGPGEDGGQGSGGQRGFDGPDLRVFIEARRSPFYEGWIKLITVESGGRRVSERALPAATENTIASAGGSGGHGGWGGAGGDGGQGGDGGDGGQGRQQTGATGGAGGPGGSGGQGGSGGRGGPGGPGGLGGDGGRIAVQVMGPEAFYQVVRQSTTIQSYGGQGGNGGQGGVGGDGGRGGFGGQGGQGGRGGFDAINNRWLGDGPDGVRGRDGEDGYDGTDGLDGSDGPNGRGREVEWTWVESA